VAAPNYPGNTAPNTGSVLFTVKDSGSNTVATLNGPSLASAVGGVSSGSIAIPAGLAVGAYMVTAAYTGQGLYASTTSTPKIFNINPVINPAPTVVSFSVLWGAQSYNVTTSARSRLPWQVTGIQVVFSAPITAGSVNSLSGVTATNLAGLGTNTLTWTI